MKIFSILSIGAGAIGTYIGGCLASVGHNVVFLEQPDVIAELNKNGMHIDLKDRMIDLHQVRTAYSIGNALSLCKYDLAILAIKSFDTDFFLTSLTPFIASFPPVLCLQNGVENEAKITKILGIDRVIPGTVTSSIERRSIGAVVLERKRGTGLSKNHPLSNQLTEVFNSAGLNARQFSDPNAMKWSKMLTNLIANASSAILDMTPGEIFSNLALAKLEIGQLREALNVMSALRLNPIDLPKTPVKALALVIRYLPPNLARLVLIMSVGKGRGGKMPSFHIDLYNKRGFSEVDYLNGAVVRYGEITGVSTPINRILNETLMHLTEGHIPLTRFAHQPQMLLDLLPK